ncbi:hypothetical protein Pfo_010230 [Paulownia fortunei]|nr:hypothetical protein Pfo_010230 [Paulownia fortunei]
MRAFIKSMDEQLEEVLKPEDQWNTEDEKIANYNSNALNAIFSAVDVNQLKLIATCESAKEAWTTLQTAYEGTATVRMSKLQILASRFEDLRMEESETIAIVNAKLCDIANEAQALGEKYSNRKLVRKALRSLPERFAYKVTAIEEAHDIENMKLDELMGSLQIFELNLNHNRRDKGKNVTFQTEVLKSTSEPEDDDDISESVTLLTKNFGKFLRKMNTKPYKPKRIQCREYEGFRHVQAKCANTRKRMDKSLTTTWSDEESERSQEKDEEVHLSNHVTLSSKMINNYCEHVATSHWYVSTVQYNATCLTSSTVIGENDLQNLD